MKSIRRYIKPVLPVFLAFLGIACAFPALAAFKFTTVDYPGAVQTQLWGINNAGQIVGYADFDYFATPGTNFVYDSRNATITTLPAVPGVESTAAIGINKSGVVVGSAGSFTQFEASGLIISNGAFAFFSHPGMSFTQGRSINDAGLITAFVTDLTGQSFGSIYNPATGSFTDFLPSLSTIAHGINKQNQVVGSANFAANGAYPGSLGGHFGFLRNANGAITLFRVNRNDNPTYARGITGTGRIAGFFLDSIAGRNRGFVGTLAGLANHVLTIPAADVLDVPGSTGTVVEGMNDAGVISGYWTDADGYWHGFLATPIPPKKK